MTILIIAEHDGIKLSPATANAVTAASKIGGAVHILLAGDNVDGIAAEASAISGVEKILYSSAPHYKNPLAENIASLAASLAAGYSHIMVAATSFGKNIAPRIAALIDATYVADAIDVLAADSFKRPIYAGNAIATVQALGKIVVSVRKVAFAAAANGGSAAVENITAQPASDKVRFVGLEAVKSERPELTNASIVVSGGRGVGSAENFKIIEGLADKLGAAVGASRAAVDAGYAPNDWQVGQTGKVVAPQLYVAVAISGAIQHLAGMKDSKVIVAINKDENAPIFEVADYGLVADLFAAIPELEKAL